MSARGGCVLEHRVGNWRSLLSHSNEGLALTFLTRLGKGATHDMHITRTLPEIFVLRASVGEGITQLGSYVEKILKKTRSEKPRQALKILSWRRDRRFAIDSHQAAWIQPS